MESPLDLQGKDEQAPSLPKTGLISSVIVDLSNETELSGSMNPLRKSQAIGLKIDGMDNTSIKFWICLLVFSPLKWYRGTLWISIPHIIVFGINLVKLVVTTVAVLNFGGCREQLSDVISHGQLVLKHN
ncbi:hypothetical protein DPMN_171128 [Dreissena polymorpha]|uniref:Uncharacterized protein n=1 Tax=Dreissena polymorpha TaxID=45954 RepID=A0A9D4IFA0_DREPO|nr:hypothetical protein DPMN_171128 [Dreissena polymorpha]